MGTRYGAKVRAQASPSERFGQTRVAPFLASGLAHADENLRDVFCGPICVGIGFGSDFATDTLEKNLLRGTRPSKVKTGLRGINLDDDLAAQQLEIRSLKAAYAQERKWVAWSTTRGRRC